MLPASGTAKPAIMRRVVVLPQPDGPIKETRLPLSTVRSSASTAAWAPKRFVRPAESRMDINGRTTRPGQAAAGKTGNLDLSSAAFSTASPMFLRTRTPAGDERRASPELQAIPVVAIHCARVVRPSVGHIVPCKSSRYLMGLHIERR